MRFELIELEDILAYEGPSEVNLRETTSEKNIVLIWGKNGFGKTSFLQAITLLFTGTAEPKFRRIGFPPKPLTPVEFVVGIPGHWQGIVNRHALNRARAMGRDATARVAATWEHEGKSYRAERSWTTNGTSFQELLVLYDGEERFTKGAAEEALERVLPKDYVEYFFFDGEDVRALAEAIDRRNIDFDQLLRLTFLSDITAELELAAKERERAGLEASLLDQIGDIEGDLARAKRAHEAATSRLTEIDEQLEIQATELERLNIRRENLGSGGSAAQKEQLEKERSETRNALAELHSKIANLVPEVAPLVINVGLINTALDAVDQRLAATSSAEGVLIRQIQEELPRWIDEAAPDLPTGARAELARALGSRLGRMVGTPSDEGIFKGLEIGRAERLRAGLVKWGLIAQERRNQHVGWLAEAHRLHLQLEQAEDALAKVEAGSQASIEEYRAVLNAITAREQQVAELHQSKGSQSARRDDAQEDLARLEEKLRDLEAQHSQASRNANEAREIRSYAKTVNDFREKLRATMRSDFARMIEDRYGRLKPDQDLIGSIELDDNYVLMMRDRQGRVLGRASLSAGLKQLVATALLWAMKDLARIDMPVIIDTPLGRIDRENQEHLLRFYYPQISSQVIVLPTNSEIDSLKRRMLEPSVATHYTIANETGEAATIERYPLVELP